MQSSQYIRSLHVIALVTAAATFSLIFMGGLDTSHGAGMSACFVSLYSADQST